MAKSYDSWSKLAKFTGEFVLHIIVTLSVVYVLFTWLDAIPAYDDAKTFDSIALANTFMVFVTFIIVVATVAISIGAVFYTKQYSQTKERLLSDNLDDVIQALVDKDKVRVDFIDKLLNDPVMSQDIEKRINSFGTVVNENVQKQNTKITALDMELKEYVKTQISESEKRLKIELSNDESTDSSIKDRFSKLDN
ncbi:hypothetical protein [Sulfurovum sp.]|uniref:hypothetical protein n=1 Tax=Sulfurovum sp. TaxID=1969726 RepID=UPI00356A2ED3